MLIVFRLKVARTLGLLLLLLPAACTPNDPHSKMEALARDISRKVTKVRLEASDKSGGRFLATRVLSVQLADHDVLVAAPANCMAFAPSDWQRCRKGGHHGLWSKTQVRLDLGGADPNSIVFSTPATLGDMTGGQAVGIACKSGRTCITFGPRPGPDASFSMVTSDDLERGMVVSAWPALIGQSTDEIGKSGAEERAPNHFILPCKSKTECQNVASEMKHLIALAAKLPPGRHQHEARGNSSGGAKPLSGVKALVRDLNQVLRDGDAHLRKAGSVSTVTAKIDGVTMARPGKLTVSYTNCSEFERIRLCGSKEWVTGSTGIDLSEIDFNGSEAREPRIQGEPKQDGDFDLTSSYITLKCKIGSDCLRPHLRPYKKARVPATPIEAAFDCQDGVTCARILLDLQALAEQAEGKKEEPPPARIGSETQAKETAKQILAVYQGGGVQYTGWSSNETYNWQGVSLSVGANASAGDSHYLKLRFLNCWKDDDPRACSITGQHQHSFLVPLSAPGHEGSLSRARSHVGYVHSHADHVAILWCYRDQACVQPIVTNDDALDVHSDVADIPCPDNNACERMLVNLWNLVVWFSEHPKEHLNVSLTDNWKRVPGDVSQAKAQAATDALNDFSYELGKASSPIFLPTKSGEGVLFGSGADLMSDGNLFVDRVVCLYTGQLPTSGNCSQPRSVAYWLLIALGSLDPSSIRTASDGYGNQYVTADCIGSSRCTRFAPSDKSNPKVQTVAKTLGDTPTPKILIPCDGDICGKLISDLKKMIATLIVTPPEEQTTAGNGKTAKPAPNANQAVPDIAGNWELDIPLPNGKTARWTMDFNANGTYRFEDQSTGSEHEGTYQCSDGTWSLEGKWVKAVGLAPGQTATYDDEGTYKLLGPNKMQLTGKAGSAVWKRINHHS